MKGRITHDDVKAFVKGFMMAPAPRDASLPAAVRCPSFLPRLRAFGSSRRSRFRGSKRISGPRLHASWVNIPHVTQFDEADITELEALRGKLKDTAAELGIKLTPLAFIVRACVRALQPFPQFNASLDLRAPT